MVDDWTKGYRDTTRDALQQEADRRRRIEKVDLALQRRIEESRRVNTAVHGELCALLAQRIRQIHAALIADGALGAVELYPARGLLSPRQLGWKILGRNLLKSGNFCYESKKLYKQSPEEVVLEILSTKRILGGDKERGHASAFSDLLNSDPDWFRKWAMEIVERWSSALVELQERNRRGSG